MCRERANEAVSSEMPPNFRHEIYHAHTHTGNHECASCAAISGEAMVTLRKTNKIEFVCTMIMLDSNCFFVGSWIIYIQCGAFGKRAEEASADRNIYVKKSRCFTYSIELIGFQSRILRKQRRTLLSFAEDYAEEGVYEAILEKPILILKKFVFE